MMKKNIEKNPDISRIYPLRDKMGLFAKKRSKIKFALIFFTILSFIYLVGCVNKGIISNQSCKIGSFCKSVNSKI